MSGTTRWPGMETERFHLRPFTAGDAAAIHRVYSDPEVMRYVVGGPVADLAGTEAMLREYGEHQEAYGFSFWAVIERASGEVIGDAGLYLFEGRGPEVELGYTIGRAGWRQGYATEAGSAWLAAAFGQFGLDEVIAVADPRNPASVRVLEKIGKRPVGRRMAYGHEHLLYRQVVAYRDRG